MYTLLTKSNEQSWTNNEHGLKMMNISLWCLFIIFVFDIANLKLSLSGKNIDKILAMKWTYISDLENKYIHTLKE